MKSQNDRKADIDYKKYGRKRIPLDVSPAEYTVLKEYCDETNQSVNGIIRKWIKEQIPDFDTRYNKAYEQYQIEMPILREQIKRG